MRERDIVDLLRSIATAPAARGLADDAAVWTPPLGRDLVLTHDTIACGVHYLPGDQPSDIAWKLVAVNLSDLAAKGAVPAGVLVSLALGGDEDADWLAGFGSGLARVLDEHGTQLWGGDTLRTRGPAVLGCTAVGHVPPGGSLARGGGNAGESLFITGTIGDAGLGLAAQRGEAPPDKFLQRRYRLPAPRLKVGQGLAAAGASAAMDVSDGLLLDAGRLADASGCAAEIDLSAVPLSDAAAARLPSGTEGLLQAASAGDDYELLIAAPGDAEPALFTLCEEARVRLTRVGRLSAGGGLTVRAPDGGLVQPERLGFEH